MKEQTHTLGEKTGVTMAWSPGSVLLGVRGLALAVPTPGLVRGTLCLLRLPHLSESLFEPEVGGVLPLPQFPH